MNCVYKEYEVKIKMVQEHSISAPLLLGVQPFVPNFEKEGDQKKSLCLGSIKESLPQVFAWGGASYVSCQKRLCKMKYGFEGSIFKCQSWPVLAKQLINF